MRRLHIGRRTWLVTALVALTLAFVAITLASSRGLQTARVDLTADHLYTLTPGTQHIIDGLHRPLKLTLYFSEHATRDLPQLRSYEQRVREMLQEMVARSRGRIRLVVIDPVPYSDDEASAEGGGLTPINGGSNGERVFFGLVGATVPGGEGGGEERSLSIPFFDPARETFLEYDIAKLLYELDQSSKPHIGLISSLPLDGNPAIGEPPWAVVQQLEQLFEVRTLDADTLTRVGDDIQVLLLVHPKRLPDAAVYALDQYVLRGGHLVVFVDPDAELDTTPYVDSNGLTDDHNSDLPRLFAAWGVTFDAHSVVLDRSRALQIELAGTNLNHPAMLGLGPQELNHNDVVTASLQRINVSTAGSFDLAPNAQTRLLPLIQSSAEAEKVPAQRVLEAASDPTALLQGYQPDNQHYVIAARLRGTFHSAFPQRAATPGHLAESRPDSEVVLVADTDILSDRLWVEMQSFLGQPMLSAFANNGDFVTNLADNLSGSSALLSIRGRSASQRPFTRVRALQAAADQKFLVKKQELERELAETRQRLDELQKNGRSSAASAQQKSEIEQFQQRRLAINKELRDVQHQLNAEIDALGLRLKVINIVLVPALVTLIGLLYGWRRVRQSRSRPG
ncbi:Gldg family protein [Frateuria sp. MAH-13]|uniref:Gldg family protein n=1 Tax=Frateuria flava TaxID=2821489 RepID=A0ABS4DI19_9GAMM|nr:Gldg family protein [Frateuria flava]MBP1472691.1 Gldg family protein [Frateuria flava]